MHYYNLKARLIAQLARSSKHAVSILLNSKALYLLVLVFIESKVSTLSLVISSTALMLVIVAILVDI